MVVSEPTVYYLYVRIITTGYCCSVKRLIVDKDTRLNVRRRPRVAMDSSPCPERCRVVGTMSSPDGEATNH